VLRLKTKQNPQMVWRDLRVQQMIIVSQADFFYRVTQSRRNLTACETQIMSLEAEVIMKLGRWWSG